MAVLHIYTKNGKYIARQKSPSWEKKSRYQTYLLSLNSSLAA